ncbi:LysR family substrate-binding domain-containing protein [Roseateles sp. NT4]|uniref:LysR family substrate-binding domain-containing protein n=1 Tax=Roseateles sp. NT4 TaxID=3453715 RepID=UPI003EEE2760
MELTVEGREVLVRAQGLIAEADALAARFRGSQAGPTSKPTSLRLGLTTVVDAGLFTWIQPALEQRLPGLRIDLRRQISQKSIQDLVRGRLDAAVIGLPSATFDLVVQGLTHDPLVVAMSSRHRLAKRRTIDLKDLGRGPLFWFRRSLNPAYFDHFEHVFRARNFAPDRLPEPQDHHVLLGLIADDQGVALVPRSLTAIGRAGVTYIPLRQDAPFQIGLALAYPAQHTHPSIPALLVELRRHFKTDRD